MKYLSLDIPGPNADTTQQLQAPPSLPEVLKGSDQNAIVQISQLGYNLFFFAVLVIAVIVIMFSGVQIITSKGDSEKIKSARTRLVYSIIGLIVLLGGFFIVNTLSTILGVKPQFLNTGTSP